MIQDSQILISLKHSCLVAKAAYIIASKSNGLIDPDQAHLAGMMHDVGKLYLKNQKLKYMHPIIGYEIMLNDNNREIADVCLAHPFPIFDNTEYISNFFQNDFIIVNKVNSILNTIKITPLIKLIQFVDKMSTIDSYISIEDKFRWYGREYNVNIYSEHINLNYIKLKEIQIELEDTIEISIYKLFKVSP